MIKVYRELLIRCDFININGEIFHEYLTREGIKDYLNMIKEEPSCGIRMLTIDYSDTYEKIEYSDIGKQCSTIRKR